MSPSTRFELSGILHGSIGSQAGVSRGTLRAMMVAVRGVHAPLVESAAAGMLPHLQALDIDRVRAVSAPLAGRPIALLAEPGVAAAVVALVTASGAPLRLLDATDAEALARAVAEPDAALVVLDGPGWVRLLAAELAPLFKTALVFSGDGTGAASWAPPGAVLIEEPGASDPRFAGVGLAAMALLAAADVPLAPVRDALAQAAERCLEPAMADNPAYALAASVLALEEKGARSPVLILPARRTLAWGRWLAGAWGAIALREELKGSLRRIRGDAGRCMLAGDEAAIQRLVLGEPDQIIVSVSGARPAGADRALSAGLSMWTLGEALREAHAAQLQQAGRPHIRLLTPALDPAGLAAAAVVWLHAALVVGAARGGDPLTMDAADAWRALLEEEILPEGLFAAP